MRSVDFERVLRCAPRARTAHFALHHLRGRPTPPAGGRAKRDRADLSTGEAPLPEWPVDDCCASTSPPAVRHWLGLVLPKRHARRAVTRSLLKRQIRAAAGRGEAALDDGLWVVRLRSPFDVRAFPSAASAALAAAAREELSTLFRQART
ncbi:MAG: ribonuclease P protein component [Piscinibacter sp.]